MNLKNEDGYIDVNVMEAQMMIEEGNLEIIDVRTPEEYYELGHIPNSKLLPLQEIGQWSKELDKEKRYLLVCRSGNRTMHASMFLAEIGYEHVYNMVGGMLEWQGEVEK